jgi:hypothetical protein
MIKVGDYYRDFCHDRVEIVATHGDCFIGQYCRSDGYMGYTATGECTTNGPDLVLDDNTLDINQGECWLDHWNNKIYIASISPSEMTDFPILGIMYPNTIGQSVANYSRGGKASNSNNYPLKEKIQNAS